MGSDISRRISNEYFKDKTSEIYFTINGTPHKACADNVPLETTLNTFIRLYANLTATKFMCREGGCGCCIVTLHGLHPVTRQLSSWTVNSCLFPIYSCHGLHIVTVEGFKNEKIGPHILQRRLVASFGTQCGYCTPGFIMTMYGLLEAKNRRVTMQEVEDAFGGNICRCTGYRPILDTFKSFATDAHRAVADIEDLPKSCAIGRRVCFETCHKEIHLRLPDGGEWHKVYTIPDIMRVLQSIEGRSYMLVCGNTARGVFPDNDYPEVYIDISNVRDLRTFTFDTVLQIGANIPLNEFIDILRKVSDIRSDFFYCRQMANHVEKVAHPAVRNVGTLAGNLILKRRHNEFLSDIFILLECIGATLTILSSIGSIKIVTVADFIKLNMNSRIIVKITLPSLPNNIHEFHSYKIMSKAQNAFADVNCAFLFKFNTNRSCILNARMCFGGINPHFVHALATEKYLMNKDLFNDCELQAACVSLANEFVLDWILPESSPKYRKMLAIGLFYKTVLKMCPSDRVRPEIRSAAFDIHRLLSSGEQQLASTLDQIPVQKLEALAQCTGDAKYINDMPYMPNEVWGALVCATEASAFIVNINTTNALNMPGVVAFYGAKDIPGINSCTHPMFGQNNNQELFCSGRIMYHGQPIGMIIAVTLDIAQAAVSQIIVTYQRDSSRLVINITDALADSKNNPKRLDRDLIGVMHSSESGTNVMYTIEGQYEIGSQYHFPLEPHTAICVPTENGIKVHCSTHWLNYVKVIVSQVVNLPENAINVTLNRVGGGFGGKLENSAFVASACALACHLQQRPVRFVFSLEACMIALGMRLPAITDYNVEVDDIGEIQNLTQDIWLDFGAYVSPSLDILTIPGLRNCYKTDYWTVRGKCIKTDTPANTWCRGPGNLEGIAMTENVMEHIARVVKRDSFDVRLQNIPEDSPIRKILQNFAESVDYRKRKFAVDSFNYMNRWKKQGIAIVPMKFLSNYYSINNCSVFVNNSDGTVNIISSGVELGQGLNTKIAQIAAKTLGIPLSMIRVGPTNGLIGNGGLGTIGSQTNSSVGYATQRACEIILERMEPVRKEMGDVPWPELTQECFKRFIPLSAMHTNLPHDHPSYPIWGAACGQVEVDILTGQVVVQRVDITEDVGKSINPHIDIGQIEGAFVMGLGYWLHEKIIRDRVTGELTTHNMKTFYPPGVKDIPADFRITLLDTGDRYLSSVMGSKGVGEPAICLSVVLTHAIRYAVDSARRDAGLSDDWYSFTYPLTPDHIQLSTGTKIHHFKL